jgi:hypothetical protein
MIAMHARCLIGSLALGISLALAPVARAQENPVFQQLVEKGVPVPDGSMVKLPPPTLTEGMDAAAQRAAIGQVAQPAHTADDLLQSSNAAPLAMQIQALKTIEGQSRVEQVEFWFVAFGDWDTMNSAEFLQSILKTVEQESKDNRVAKSGTLTPQQLAARNIQPPPASPGLEQSWFYTTFSLFGKVQVSSTRHTAIMRQPNTSILAGIVDPRFTGDAEFPDQWRPMSRDDSGQLQIGPPVPYTSAGFYLKVTRLIDPAGAALIEYHMVFDEPTGWFGGANLLRSKLPLVVQDEVRNFRRRLAAASNK